MKYQLSKAFSMSVQRTPRVLEVAETFGVGVSDREFVVLDNLEIEVNQGDVVYITGQSGAGKSVILRELSREMEKFGGLKVANIDHVPFTDKPLIDQVGKNMGEAMELLARAGLADAKLMISTPAQLSDGQKYRLRLALLMQSDADVWTADEFGAVLDRTTAQVVAFNVQKAARKLGKTLIVATTHTDLEHELGPSLVITKRYGDRIEMRVP